VKVKVKASKRLHRPDVPRISQISVRVPGKPNGVIGNV